MLRILLLLAAVCICQGKTYKSSSLSKTYVKTSKWSLSTKVSMNTDDNTLTIELVGPLNVWYSVGFGNKKMDKTYCIVVDGNGDVTERYLTGTTEGDLLDFTWTIDSNVESSNYRTVTLSREYDYELPTEYHNSFDVSDKYLETIYAYGSNADLDNHGDSQRGSSKLKASRKSLDMININNEINNENNKNKKLWGDASTAVMEEEYEAYLTTSSVLTWITCIIAAAVIGWLIYKKYYHRQYNEIPDNCNSNISMVPMGHSIESSHVAV